MVSLKNAVFIDSGGVSFAFSDISGEPSVLEQLDIHCSFEHDGEALMFTTYNFPHQTQPFLKGKNGELDVDTLALFDLLFGPDKHTTRTNISGQVPELSFFG
jgi:hypothetical protein